MIADAKSHFDHTPKPINGISVAAASYFKRRRIFYILNRHKLWLWLAMLIGAPLFAAYVWSKPLLFSSIVNVIYDPKADFDSGGDSAARFQQIEGRLQQIHDASYLRPIVIAGRFTDDDAMSLSWSDRLRVFWRRIQRTEGMPSRDEALADQQRREAMAIGELARRIKTASDAASLTLTIKVAAETPELAQALASRLADDFVGRELRYQVDRFNSLSRKRSESLKPTKGDSVPRPSSLLTPIGPAGMVDAHLSKQRLIDLQAREAGLLDRIQLLRNSSNVSAKVIQRRRAELQSDLVRLHTTLKPSHPDVVLKEEELRELDAALSMPSVNEAMASLQDELKQVRLDMYQIQTRSEFNNAQEASGQSLLSASQKHFMPPLEDKADAERQVGNSQLSPGFLQSSPPTRAVQSEQNRYRMLAQLIGIWALTLILMVLFIELFDSKARDPWRIAARLDTPALAAFPKSALRRYQSISPQLFDRLLHMEGAPRRAPPEVAATLACYRQLLQSLKAHCQERRWLFLNVGLAPATSSFFYSFANIYAKDFGESVVVIDCDDRNPLQSDVACEHHKADTYTLLWGESSWRETRLPRTSERIFDLVPAPTAPSTTKPRGIRQAALAELLTALSKPYDVTFMRAAYRPMSIEISVTVQVASDVVIILPSGQASLAELLRLRQLAGDKLRGFVFLA